MLKYIIFVPAVLISCIKAEKEPLSIVPVFKSLCDSAIRNSCARADYYYVYNYKEEDSLKILYSFNSFKPDTQHLYHFVYFFKFDNSLPDTADLNLKMKMGPLHELKESPGSGEYKQHLIMYYSYSGSFMKKGHQVPSYYILTRIYKGRRKEKYYIKNKDTNKFKEVGFEGINSDLTLQP